MVAEFLGQQVAKTDIDAFDGPSRVDGFGVEGFEMGHELLARVGALTELSLLACVRVAALATHAPRAMFAGDKGPARLVLGYEIASPRCRHPRRCRAVLRPRGSFRRRSSAVLLRRLPQPSRYDALPLASSRRTSRASLP